MLCHFNHTSISIFISFLLFKNTLWVYLFIYIHLWHYVSVYHRIQIHEQKNHMANQYIHCLQIVLYIHILEIKTHIFQMDSVRIRLYGQNENETKNRCISTWIYVHAYLSGEFKAANSSSSKKRTEYIYSNVCIYTLMLNKHTASLQSEKV